MAAGGCPETDYEPKARAVSSRKFVIRVCRGCNKNSVYLWEKFCYDCGGKIESVNAVEVRSPEI